MMTESLEATIADLLAPPDGCDDRQDFTPVPSGRRRHDGWTPERQRGFIAQLARIGVISAAARAVGMSRKSAYALYDRAGEGSTFRRAWHDALSEGRIRAQDLAIERAIHGYTITRIRVGPGMVSEHRYDNRLIAAALNPAQFKRGRGG